MYNLFTLIRVEKGVFESGALAAAVTQALGNHPSLATTFSINDDCEIVQSHHPELVADDLACFLYRGDIRGGGAESAAFEQVDIRQNRAASQAIMDTEVVGLLLCVSAPLRDSQLPF